VVLHRDSPAGQGAREVVASGGTVVRTTFIGAAGLVISVILIGGLAISAGWQWAALGSVMLLPMIAGSAFLCVRFLRARQVLRLKR